MKFSFLFPLKAGLILARSKDEIRAAAPEWYFDFRIGRENDYLNIELRDERG